MKTQVNVKPVIGGTFTLAEVKDRKGMYRHPNHSATVFISDGCANGLISVTGRHGYIRSAEDPRYREGHFPTSTFPPDGYVTASPGDSVLFEQDG